MSTSSNSAPNGTVVGSNSAPTSTMSNLRSSAVANRKDLKHPASKNWLIHLHYIRREFGTCKSIIFEELQRTNGHSEYANYVLALIYRSEGKMQESLDKLQVCHELEPTNANTVKQIARSLFLLGRHKLAVDAYQKAQMLNDDSDSETHYNMGMCYIFMKDLEKAKEHMNLSLQARVSQEAFEALANIALAKKNIHDAIIVYEKAVRIFPENSELLSNLGLLYMKVGRDDVSYYRLGASLSFDSQNSKSLVAIACMIQTHEDFENALAKYKGAMQNLPDSASVWNNVGMCFFFGKKKYVAAISCLKRAYYLSPFDWKILHNLGLVHLHMQQYTSAFHFLTASINLKPEQSHNFMLLGVAISHLEDLDYAKHAYEQAVKLNSVTTNTDSSTLSLNYAISLHNHKQYDIAYEKLTQVQGIISNSPRDVIDPDVKVKASLNKVKIAMKQHGYKFPEDNPDPEILPGPKKQPIMSNEMSSSTATILGEEQQSQKSLKKSIVDETVDQDDLV